MAVRCGWPPSTSCRRGGQLLPPGRRDRDSPDANRGPPPVGVGGRLVAHWRVDRLRLPARVCRALWRAASGAVLGLVRRQRDAKDFQPQTPRRRRRGFGSLFTAASDSRAGRDLVVSPRLWLARGLRLAAPLLLGTWRCGRRAAPGHCGAAARRLCAAGCRGWPGLDRAALERPVLGSRTLGIAPWPRLVLFPIPWVPMTCRFPTPLTSSGCVSSWFSRDPWPVASMPPRWPQPRPRCHWSSAFRRRRLAFTCGDPGTGAGTASVTSGRLAITLSARDEAGRSPHLTP